MGSSEDDLLAVTPARSGRPRTTNGLVRPDDLVRVEVRMPASVAADLYQLARDTGQPVSQTATTTGKRTRGPRG